MTISRKIVIFEGIDRSGKTEAAKRFAKISKYQHITISRGFVSNIVYDLIYRKISSFDKWATIASSLSSSLVVVLIERPNYSRRFTQDRFLFRYIAMKFAAFVNCEVYYLNNKSSLVSLDQSLKRLSIHLK